MNMTINQNDGASSSKSFETSDDSGSPSWSNFDQDLLFTIMMKLEILDFIAFRRVCKSWRSLALDHINKYMVCRQPMSVTFSTDTKNECYFKDFEGRKIKTILPHSTDSTCVGITCGYLIFFKSTTHDFWLVNPFTSHELHFPCVPFDVDTDPSIFRGILVFSPSISRWVLVFAHKSSDQISFSLSGNQPSWSHLTSDSRIIDIHFFKGKIYTITNFNRLYEVKLDPKPSLIRLGMKNSPERFNFSSEFVNSDKNLYVGDYIAAGVYEFYEIDLEKLEWVLTEKRSLEHAFFMGYMKGSAAINPDTWDDSHDSRIQYERFGYLMDLDRSEIKGSLLGQDVWYFPHDCLYVNTLQP